MSLELSLNNTHGFLDSQSRRYTRRQCFTASNSAVPNKHCGCLSSRSSSAGPPWPTHQVLRGQGRIAELNAIQKKKQSASAATPTHGEASVVLTTSLPATPADQVAFTSHREASVRSRGTPVHLAGTLATHPKASVRSRGTPATCPEAAVSSHGTPAHLAPTPAQQESSVYPAATPATPACQESSAPIAITPAHQESTPTNPASSPVSRGRPPSTTEFEDCTFNSIVEQVDRESHAEEISQDLLLFEKAAAFNKALAQELHMHYNQ